MEFLQELRALEGAAVVGMQHQGPIDHPLGEHRTLDDQARVVGRLAVEDLPADDFAAVDVDDHHQKEKQPLDRPRQPGAIPGPDLIGASGLVGRWLGSAAWGPWPAPDEPDRRGGAAPDRIWRPSPDSAAPHRAGAPRSAPAVDWRTPGDGTPPGCGLLLLGTERMGRLRTHRLRTLVFAHATFARPPLNGAHPQTQDLTGQRPPRLGDRLDGLTAIRGTDHHASTPQIACTFFDSTNNAAVSASAASLRCTRAPTPESGSAEPSSPRPRAAAPAATYSPPAHNSDANAPTAPDTGHDDDSTQRSLPYSAPPSPPPPQSNPSTTPPSPPGESASGRQRPNARCLFPPLIHRRQGDSLLLVDLARTRVVRR